MAAPRILYVLDSLSGGGAEISTSKLWYFLRTQNMDFRILVLMHTNVGIEDQITREDFDVHFLQSSGFLKASREIAAEIDRYEPNIVHSILFQSNVRVRMAKLLADKKFIHLESLVNCTYDNSRLNDPNVNLLKLKAYQLFDYVTQLYCVDHYQANGEVVAAHYSTKLKVRDQRISVINRGREENPFIDSREAVRQEIRKEFNLPSESIILINAARQEYQKAQEVLIEAFHNLPPEFSNVFLLIAGRRGNNSIKIDDLLKKCKNENIMVLGYRSDITRLLAGSDIFVLPSRFEGLPGSIIEAEAAGLPIIATDIATIRETVRVNENALVFRRDDAAALMESLKKLIENPDLRQKFGQCSLALFEEKYKLDRINSKMLNLYISLLN